MSVENIQHLPQQQQHQQAQSNGFAGRAVAIGGNGYIDYNKVLANVTSIKLKVYFKFNGTEDLGGDTESNSTAFRSLT